MRVIVALLTVGICVNGWAIGRPTSGNKGRGERSGEVQARSLEKVESLNNAASRILGQDIKVELPSRLSGQEAKVLEQKLDSLVKALETKQSDILRDANKKAEIASLLEQMTPAMRARDSYKEFVESNQGDAKANETAENVIRLIDNLFTIMEAKVAETAETPVSTGQIARVLSELGRTKNSGLKAEDIFETEVKITSIFGKDYTLEQVARCR